MNNLLRFRWESKKVEQNELNFWREHTTQLYKSYENSKTDQEKTPLFLCLSSFKWAF